MPHGHFTVTSRSPQLSHGSQEFRRYPLGLPVVEVGRLDVVVQQAPDPQFPAIDQFVFEFSAMTESEPWSSA